MTGRRVVETDRGIQGEFNVTMYDQMQKHLRDRGWIETGDILKSGITSGYALEVGSGPGYLGLEWLKHTQGTRLKGIDISPDMLNVAERNAADYGLSERVEYVAGNAEQMSFDAEMFDAVFSNGSLHEWATPRRVLGEAWRVLKRGGRIFISDLRRDMFFVVKWFILANVRPPEMRTGFRTSVAAAYTLRELQELVKGTPLETCQISKNPIGLLMVGEKAVVPRKAQPVRGS